MAGPDGGEAPSSSAMLIRLTVVLIAVWSGAAGLMLTIFAGEGAGALGSGVADDAGSRLAGAHMLVLTPLYVLIAWMPHRFAMLLWVPFFAQAATALMIAYSIMAGDTNTLDGLPFMVISGSLAGLLGFFWVSEQRAVARRKYEASLELDASDEGEEP